MAKVMKLINPDTGHMVCRVCGVAHYANRAGGRFRPGSWQCRNGCKPGERPLNEAEKAEAAFGAAFAAMDAERKRKR
jgi:hypothetical protein